MPLRLQRQRLLDKPKLVGRIWFQRFPEGRQTEN